LPDFLIGPIFVVLTCLNSLLKKFFFHFLELYLGLSP